MIIYDSIARRKKQSHSPKASLPAGLTFKQLFEDFDKRIRVAAELFNVEDEMDVSLFSDRKYRSDLAIDKLNWLVSIIRTCHFKADTKQSEFTPVHSSILKELVGEHYRKYLDLLIHFGIIEEDREYIIGVKSRGYRWTTKYLNQQKVNREFRNGKFKEKLRKQREQKAKGLKRHHDQLIQALYYIDLDVESATRYIELLDNEVKEAAEYGIESIVNQDYAWCHPCQYGRFHSPLSNLKKELRRYLSINGEQLSEIDIANSQPLFFAVKVMEEIVGSCIKGKSNSNRSYVSGLIVSDCNETSYNEALLKQVVEQTEQRKRGELYDTKSNSNRSYVSGLIVNDCMVRGYDNLLILTRQSKQDIAGQLRMPKEQRDNLPYKDFLDWLEWSQEGTLYQHMMDEIQWRYDLNTFKSEVFMPWWGGDVFQDFDNQHYIAKAKQAIEKRFPTVTAIINQMKQPNFERFAQELQRQESKFCIDHIAKEIVKQHPLATIHDSWLVQQSIANEIKQFIEGEFEQLYGMKLKLRTKHLENESFQPADTIKIFNQDSSTKKHLIKTLGLSMKLFKVAEWRRGKERDAKHKTDIAFAYYVPIKYLNGCTIMGREEAWERFKKRSEASKRGIITRMARAEMKRKIYQSNLRQQDISKQLIEEGLSSNGRTTSNQDNLRNDLSRGISRQLVYENVTLRGDVCLAQGSQVCQQSRIL